MKKILISAIALLFMLNTTAFAEENISTISVNGEGIVETSPDRATVTISVINRDRDAGKVQATNAKTTSGVIQSIVALGIERKNIRTGSYNFHPTYRQEENRRQVLTGYEASNTITVIIDNLNLVGKVIDTSLSHGANNVNSLSFGLRDKKALQNEALRLATRDARTKAEIVASELGKVILGVKSVSINSSSISSPQRYNKMAMLGSSDMMVAETPIESGTLNCTANVHVEFIVSR